MILLKRVSGKLRALARHLGAGIEAQRIQRWKRYEKFQAPPLDHDFQRALCDAGSPPRRLLAENEAAIADAERLATGQLRVFSYQVTMGSNGFSWHSDFGSGKLYPRLPYPRLTIAPNEGHDIVVPWELSRLQFIPTLVQAHALTG
ncbi:MAG: hypothetical protein RBU21_21610, partial [FCB group bacterium]|nr:hypothetical protein [FCB group bacterium]